MASASCPRASASGARKRRDASLAEEPRRLVEQLVRAIPAPALRLQAAEILEPVAEDFLHRVAARHVDGGPEVRPRSHPLAAPRAHEAEVVLHGRDARLLAEAAEAVQGFVVAHGRRRKVALAQVREAHAAQGLGGKARIPVRLGEAERASRMPHRLVVVPEAHEDARALEQQHDAGRDRAQAAVASQPRAQEFVRLVNLAAVEELDRAVHEAP